MMPIELGPAEGFECVIEIEDRILMTAIPSKVVERTLEADGESLSGSFFMRNVITRPFLDRQGGSQRFR